MIATNGNRLTLVQLGRHDAEHSRATERGKCDSPLIVLRPTLGSEESCGEQMVDKGSGTPFAIHSVVVTRCACYKTRNEIPLASEYISVLCLYLIEIGKLAYAPVARLHDSRFHAPVLTVLGCHAYILFFPRTVVAHVVYHHVYTFAP